MTLWYTARGAGLAALVLLTVATSVGALTSAAGRGTGRSGRATGPTGPAGRVVAQYAHRAAAGFGLGLVAVHVGTILADAKAGVGAAGAFVPFASAYRPGAVALGSLAAYLLLAVAALGLARGRLAASPTAALAWRAVHTLAYGAWGLAMLHGIEAGTDTGLGWMRTLWVLCLLAVVGSLTVRLGGYGRRRRVAGVLR